MTNVLDAILQFVKMASAVNPCSPATVATATGVNGNGFVAVVGSSNRQICY
jgi:hypothetical protein